MSSGRALEIPSGYLLWSCLHSFVGMSLASFRLLWAALLPSASFGRLIFVNSLSRTVVSDYFMCCTNSEEAQLGCFRLENFYGFCMGYAIIMIIGRGMLRRLSYSSSWGRKGRETEGCPDFSSSLITILTRNLEDELLFT